VRCARNQRDVVRRIVYEKRGYSQKDQREPGREANAARRTARPHGDHEVATQCRDAEQAYAG
jgi:hypothetical protein